MLSFSPLEKPDHSVLLEWLQLPHVKEWWDDGDDTLEKVSTHYSSDPDTTHRFLIRDDARPIGYIQSYRIDKSTAGIDLFLAKTDYLDRGIGTEAVLLFTAMLGENRGISKFVVDPEPGNLRAIRCYEKAGFVFDRIAPGDNGKWAYFMCMETHNIQRR